eukprot:12282307-Alexandrium_andersonii.AAC.1
MRARRHLHTGVRTGFTLRRALLPLVQVPSRPRGGEGRRGRTPAGESKAERGRRAKALESTSRRTTATTP